MFFIKGIFDCLIQCNHLRSHKCLQCTDTGMTDGHRAFCMGNALVTGVPHRIGKAMVEVYSL